MEGNEKGEKGMEKLRSNQERKGEWKVNRKWEWSYGEQREEIERKRGSCVLMFYLEADKSCRSA